VQFCPALVMKSSEIVTVPPPPVEFACVTRNGPCASTLGGEQLVVATNPPKYSPLRLLPRNVWRWMFLVTETPLAVYESVAVLVEVKLIEMLPTEGTVTPPFHGPVYAGPLGWNRPPL
jgi:hypothetical protein